MPTVSLAVVVISPSASAGLIARGSIEKRLRPKTFSAPLEPHLLGETARRQGSRACGSEPCLTDLGLSQARDDTLVGPRQKVEDLEGTSGGSEVEWVARSRLRHPSVTRTTARGLGLDVEERIDAVRIREVDASATDHIVLPRK